MYRTTRSRRIAVRLSVAVALAVAPSAAVAAPALAESVPHTETGDIARPHHFWRDRSAPQHSRPHWGDTVIWDRGHRPPRHRLPHHRSPHHGWHQHDWNHGWRDHSRPGFLRPHPRVLIPLPWTGSAF